MGGTAAIREIVTDDDGGNDAPTRIERVGSKRASGTQQIEHATAASDAPSSWRIRYRVATPGSVITEDLVVRAPFESHADVRTNGSFSETREAALGVAVTKPARGTAVGLAPAPEAAGFRPGPIVADAVDEGVLVEREQRTVAGRRCQVYRTSSVFGGTTFAAPTSDLEFVDVCVDADGLLLELVETFEGRYIRQRVAESVDVEVSVTDDELNDLPHEQTIPANQGGGSIRRVDPSSAPVGPFLVVDAPPSGYQLLGRFEVIPPQPDISNPSTRGQVVAATSDVYVSGASMITVERGARLDKAAPWEPDDRFPDVDLAPTAASGEFLAGVTGGEVRALLGSGRFVRVYGTAPLAELTAVARALRQTDTGTGPVYLDG